MEPGGRAGHSRATIKPKRKSKDETNVPAHCSSRRRCCIKASIARHEISSRLGKRKVSRNLTDAPLAEYLNYDISRLNLSFYGVDWRANKGRPRKISERTKMESKASGWGVGFFQASGSCSRGSNNDGATITWVDALRGPGSRHGRRAESWIEERGDKQQETAQSI